MRWYMVTFCSTLLISSVLHFALATPVALGGMREVRSDALYITKDRRAALQKRMGYDEELTNEGNLNNSPESDSDSEDESEALGLTLPRFLGAGGPLPSGHSKDGSLPSDDSSNIFDMISSDEDDGSPPSYDSSDIFDISSDEGNVGAKPDEDNVRVTPNDNSGLLPSDDSDDIFDISSDEDNVGTEPDNNKGLLPSSSPDIFDIPSDEDHSSLLPSSSSSDMFDISSDEDDVKPDQDNIVAKPIEDDVGAKSDEDNGLLSPGDSSDAVHISSKGDDVGAKSDKDDGSVPSGEDNKSDMPSGYEPTEHTSLGQLLETDLGKLLSSFRPKPRNFGSGALQTF